MDSSMTTIPAATHHHRGANLRVARCVVLVTASLCILLVSLLKAQEVLWRTTPDNDPVQRDSPRIIALTNDHFILPS